MSAQTRRIIRVVGVLLIFLLAGYFRFSKLGYSEFQGDEISAQNYLFGSQDFLNFLLTRQVGPGQYLVSFVANLIAFQFKLHPEFVVRAPFALAGLAVVVITYFFCKKYFGERAAFISTALVASSGLLIAFSRIVQYQSFVILLSLLCVAVHLWYLKKNKNILIAALCGTLCGISLLFHYDSLSFVLPIVFYMLIKKDRGGLTIILGLAVLIAGLFYIPFILRPEFRTTLAYLFRTRIGSSPTQDSLVSSIRLLEIYHSREWLIAVLLGIVAVLIWPIKTSSKYLKVFVFITLGLIFARIIFRDRSTCLVIFSVIFSSVAFVNYFLKRVERSLTDRAVGLLIIWFGVSFICYGLLFSKPLTHIYCFFIPLVMLLSYLLSQSLTAGTSAVKTLGWAVLGAAFLSAVSFNYQAFIDTSREYPWEHKSYLFGSMPGYIAEKQKVDGIFGFPYFRGWREIAQNVGELKKTYGVMAYSSNEKYRLTKYYIRGMKWEETAPDIFICIKNPQSVSQDCTKPSLAKLIRSSDNYEIYVLTR